MEEGQQIKEQEPAPTKYDLDHMTATEFEKYQTEKVKRELQKGLNEEEKDNEASKALLDIVKKKKREKD